MPFEMNVDETLALMDNIRRRTKRQEPRLTVEITSSPSRSASENLRIASEQAERGRNPYFLGARERKGLKKIAASMVSAWSKGRSYNVRSTFDQMGRFVVDSIQQNFDKGRSKAARGGGSRPMKPIHKDYAEYKRQRGLKVRPLQATGELYSALVFRVKM